MFSTTTVCLCPLVPAPRCVCQEREAQRRGGGCGRRLRGCVGCVCGGGGWGREKMGSFARASLSFLRVTLLFFLFHRKKAFSRDAKHRAPPPLSHHFPFSSTLLSFIDGLVYVLLCHTSSLLCSALFCSHYPHTVDVWPCKFIPSFFCFTPSFFFVGERSQRTAQKNKEKATRTDTFRTERKHEEKWVGGGAGNLWGPLVIPAHVLTKPGYRYHRAYSSPGLLLFCPPLRLLPFLHLTHNTSAHKTHEGRETLALTRFSIPVYPTPPHRRAGQGKTVPGVFFLLFFFISLFIYSFISTVSLRPSLFPQGGPLPSVWVTATSVGFPLGIWGCRLFGLSQRENGGRRGGLRPHATHLKKAEGVCLSLLMCFFPFFLF